MESGLFQPLDSRRRKTFYLSLGDMDQVQGRQGHQVEPHFRPASRLWLPDDGTERSGRADPPEGHAGDPDHGRRARRLDARAMG